MDMNFTPDTEQVDASQGAGDVAAEGGVTVSLGEVTDEQIREATVAVSSMLRGLDFAFLQVREFHRAFGHPVASEPTVLDRERMENRAKWMLEEIEEFLDPNKHTVVDGADAMIDLIYFAIGTLVEMGVLPQSIMDIVHGANMGKLHKIDGKMVPVYREDGKTKKPENWERDFAPEPKLTAEVHRQAKTRLLSALGA